MSNAGAYVGEDDRSTAVRDGKELRIITNRIRCAAVPQLTGFVMAPNPYLSILVQSCIHVIVTG